MSRERFKLPGVKESQRFLNFESGFHKIGFIVLLGIIFLAVLGVFSVGYLSDVQRKNKTNTVTLNYERFGRLQTAFNIKISAHPFRSGHHIFSIGGDFNTFYETKNIWPQPDNMYSKGDTFYLVYNNSENQQESSIWLVVTPVKFGNLESTVQLNGEPEIRIRQFIYP